MGKVTRTINRAKEFYLKFGVREFAKRIVTKILHLDEVNYQKWSKIQQPNPEILQMQRKVSLKNPPLISIVVPLYYTPKSYLVDMIDSVLEQTYSNWELCLSDGSGKDSPLDEVLLKYQNRDSRIHVINLGVKLNISENTNAALQLITGDYIAFMDHDDLLTPDALFECAKEIKQQRYPDILYSDEDKITMDGKKVFQPHFKSDFNLDLLRSMNYFCHLTVVKYEIFQKVGFIRTEFDGAQDYDFVLRCMEQATHIYHIPKVLYHWRAHKQSTAENVTSKVYAIDAGKRALEAHYTRIGIHARVIWIPEYGIYRTQYKIKGKPMVSIIIPNKDHTADLDTCIRSLEQKTSYDNYEFIIVENNSEEVETFAYYQRLQDENPRVKVVTFRGDFNYSKINNFGVTYAKGEYLWFLNNDTEAISKNCLEELLSNCARPEVGGAGALLFYKDQVIQHAGIVIGYAEMAGHAFIGQLRGEPGYFSRIMCTQNYSAVTAACMMVKRSIFNEVGGFTEELCVALNDVDFCLKVQEQGKLIVYHPYAQLYHYESKSRGLEDTPEKKKRFQEEIFFFQKRWKSILAQGDPYYNINLTLRKPDFSIKNLDEL